MEKVDERRNAKAIQITKKLEDLGVDKYVIQNARVWIYIKLYC